MNVFEILVEYRGAFLAGLLVTLKLSALIWGSGLSMGTALGVISNRWPVAVGYPARALAALLSGVPILVFLFWMHYPAQSLFDVVIDPFITASLALSIVNVFAVAEIVRQSLADFPKQYVMAARVLGITDRNTLLHIQFPLLLRQVLPGILLLQVTMLQATLFASLISVDEIFRVAQRINAQVYRPVEIYTSLGVFFAMVCIPLNLLALAFRHRYTRDTSES